MAQLCGKNELCHKDLLLIEMKIMICYFLTLINRHTVDNNQKCGMPLLQQMRIDLQYIILKTRPSVTSYIQNKTKCNLQIMFLKKQDQVSEVILLTFVLHFIIFTQFIKFISTFCSNYSN